MSFLLNSLTLSFSLSILGAPQLSLTPYLLEEPALTSGASHALSRSSLVIGKNQDVRQDGLQDLGLVWS